MELDEQSLYMRGSWYYSYEYEEHVKHLGFSEETVCWELIGYVKGYLRAVYGKDIVVYEESCRGRKDANCTFVACSPHLAPPEQLNEISYFDTDCLVSKFDDLYQKMEQSQLVVQQADELNEQLMNRLLKEKSLRTLLMLMSEELNISIVAERSMIRHPFEQVMLDDAHNAVYKQYSEAKRIDGHLEILKVQSNQTVYAKLILISDTPIHPVTKQVVERSLPIFVWYFNVTLRNATRNWQQQAEAFELLLQQQKLEHIDPQLFSINFTEPFRVVVLKSDVADVYEQYLSLEKHVNDLFIMKNELILLVQETIHRAREVAELCVYDFEKAFPKNQGYFGVGRTVRSLADLRTSYEEAVKLSNFLAHCSKKRVQVVDYEEMQHVLLFLQTADPSQLVSYYETVIGALIDYDQRQDAQLLYTLQIYFEHNGNLNKTAKQLNLSLPGLRYRIEKIESLISVDIKTGDGRFQCQLALQFYYAVQAIHS